MKWAKMSPRSLSARVLHTGCRWLCSVRNVIHGGVLPSGDLSLPSFNKESRGHSSSHCQEVGPVQWYLAVGLHELGCRSRVHARWSSPNVWFPKPSVLFCRFVHPSLLDADWRDTSPGFPGRLTSLIGPIPHLPRPSSLWTQLPSCREVANEVGWLHRHWDPPTGILAQRRRITLPVSFAAGLAIVLH